MKNKHKKKFLFIDEKYQSKTKVVKQVVLEGTFCSETRLN